MEVEQMEASSTNSSSTNKFKKIWWKSCNTVKSKTQITRRVHGKFNCITVKYNGTQHGLYLLNKCSGWASQSIQSIFFSCVTVAQEKYKECTINSSIVKTQLCWKSGWPNATEQIRMLLIPKDVSWRLIRILDTIVTSYKLTANVYSYWFEYSQYPVNNTYNRLLWLEGAAQEKITFKNDPAYL